MVRCRVDGAHRNTSVHYVPQSEFDDWRAELEQRYARVVTVDEVSTWVPQSPKVLREAADADTLHPVLKVRYEKRGPRGEVHRSFRFLSSDSWLEVSAARLAGLDTAPGYFLSSVPLRLYVADDIDETELELDLQSESELMREVA
jgi:hypothetical protein